MDIDRIPRYPVTIDGETTAIGTAQELAVALDVLQGQYDRAVLEQLGAQLGDIIRTPEDFTLVVKSLVPADQIYLIDTLDGRLAGILREGRFLRDLLATMADTEVEQHLLDALGAQGLRRLLRSAQELSEVLEWLYGQCERRLLEAVGLDYVCRLANNGAELSAILSAVDRGMQERLIDEVGWDCVLSNISDGRDLAYLVRALPPAASARLLDHYTRERLVELIGNEADWDYLWDRLEPAEVETLRAKLLEAPHAA